MTYCLGILTRSGLVMAADSLTNAGVDYVSTFHKLFDFSQPGERVLLICTSGNLSMTQGVITLLRHDLKGQAAVNLHTLPTMYEITRYVGGKVRQILDENRTWLQQDNIDFQCSLIVGGQIKGEPPELFLVYSQGNFLQATQETPFLQVGETKYGKPILDRTLTFDSSLDAATKCALLSIDSTMKSNLSVGPPINLVMYEADTFIIRHQLELPMGDPYLVTMRKSWETSLKRAFEHLPEIEWQPSTELLPPTSPVPAPEHH